MTIVKDSRGNLIDFAVLTAKHEHTRAVGNQQVNARGDKIDSNGNVVVSKPTTVQNSYDAVVETKLKSPEQIDPPVVRKKGKQ